MTDHELLLAISNMFDTKLRAELQALKEELRTEIQEVRAELQEVKIEQQKMKAEIQELRAEIQEVKAEQQALKDELRCIKLYQENVIVPRLNTIEACYTGTYRRYASYVEKLESTFQDVEMLKIVVAEHSEKLKKLA
ncbi:MAG: hypothetical protein K2L82_16355 [Lachnospiraceae bacterium]|nr:hypothetical protein [Lachnospiraceae bacterium]